MEPARRGRKRAVVDLTELGEDGMDDATANISSMSRSKGTKGTRMKYCYVSYCFYIHALLFRYLQKQDQTTNSVF
jgi:hypothetical protein